MEGQEATDEDDVVRILILGQKDAMTLRLAMKKDGTGWKW